MIKKCPSLQMEIRALINVRFHMMSKSVRRTSRHIFVPALPVVAALFFSSLIGLSDAFLAGKMSTSDLAALGFSEPIWFLLNLSMTGLCTGVATGLASRYTGPKQLGTSDPKSAEFQNFMVDSLILSLLVGSFLMFSGFLVSLVLQQNPLWLSGTAILVARYFLICSLSNIPFALMQAQCAIFRAIERTSGVLWLWATTTLVEISLSSYVVLRAPSVPNLSGLDILAASWNLACVISVMIGFAMITDLFKRFNLRNYFYGRVKHLENATYILKIGIPIAVSELGLVSASLLYLQMLSDSPHPQSIEAAWATKSRIEDFFEVAPATAIALMATPFIARNINSKRERRSSWSVRVIIEAAAISALLLLCASLCMPFIANKLIDCLGGDVAFQTSARSVVSLGSLAWPCFAVARVLTGALEGTGQSLVPTLVNLACALPIRLGIASILKNSSPMSGVLAITISGIIAQALLALAMWHLFRRTFCAAAKIDKSCASYETADRSL